MRDRLILSLAVFGSLGLLFAEESPLPSPSPAALEESVLDEAAFLEAAELAERQAGVQPLAKGPVHEAFAAPIPDGPPQPGPVIPKEPPEPIEELPPAEKPAGDNVQWIPGYWAWDEENQEFIWVSGIWRNVPPGRRWVPGRYQRTEGGWQRVAGFWASEDQAELPVLPVPPQRLNEAVPPRPSEDAVLIPGNWVFIETRYVWRPSCWCIYRPGWVWVPDYYVWTPCGVVYVEGYWDYPLHLRGLLFAPCRIIPAVAFVPGVRFCYSPSLIINDRCLMTALFVHPRCGWYYFGDFFDPCYRSWGYVSWVHFRIGRSACDPLFGYYRAHYCRRPGWERDLCGLYEARFAGMAPRPPATLAQQNTLVQQLREGNKGSARIQDLALLAPANKVNAKVVKLQVLDEKRRAEEKQAAQRLQEIARSRERQETTLALLKGSDPAAQSPKKIKLDPPPRVESKPSGSAAAERPPRKAPPPPVSLAAADHLSKLDKPRSPSADKLTPSAPSKDAKGGAKGAASQASRDREAPEAGKAAKEPARPVTPPISEANKPNQSRQTPDISKPKALGEKKLPALPLEAKGGKEQSPKPKLPTFPATENKRPASPPPLPPASPRVGPQPVKPDAGKVPRPDKISPDRPPKPATPKIGSEPSRPSIPKLPNDSGSITPRLPSSGPAPGSVKPPIPQIKGGVPRPSNGPQNGGNKGKGKK
jgi:hypothetical protein